MAKLDLLDGESGQSVFVPIYEVTEAGEPKNSHSQLTVRAQMGRNRKGPGVKRYEGKVQNIKLVDQGPLRFIYEIDFTLEGFSMVTLALVVYRNQPRMDVSLRVNKDSVWNPENVYFPLPLQPGEEGELWVEKAGAWIRPGIDQLPETLTDWYCLQSGYVSLGSEIGIAVNCLDAPLVQFGPLDYGDRVLASDGQPERKSSDAAGWLMTNYWETNFEACLGGFHEFRYRIAWGSGLQDKELAFNTCHRLTREPVVVRTVRDSERTVVLNLSPRAAQ